MDENEINFDDLDILDKEEFLELLNDPQKFALEICPVEIWKQIISIVEDIPTLTSLYLTCSTLRELTKDQLLTQMATIPPLKKLNNYTKANHPEFTNQKEIILKMHKFIDIVVIEGKVEPSKWTDNMQEWDGYNESLDVWANQESFRREVGRKGKAKTRSHIVWEKDVDNEKKLLKRELAKCWAIAGKMFPFSHTENREWKKKHFLQQENSIKRQRRKIKSALVPQKPPKAPRRKGSGNKATRSLNSDITWKYTHEIRNQHKPARPNLGKGEEEFNRKILTNYVTPKHFNSGEEFEGLSHDVLTIVMVKMLKLFDDSDERVLKYPKELNGYQRKQLHHQAEIRGLRSISFGEGEGRFLVVMRKDVEIFR
ncbi:16890_t:CDS:2 [Funneliformis geosporum]|uniref:18795_t:CDS:1 n=1 Tax=Funneliformis geosporum TaxID=1117311 RepID=A0A9W4WZE1_9GLOM|nr:18795_t:CDS:2 [Funneliformis geosporum]CAI2183812.1 16890_t:CDS:2 [Funneliformis geosporum]